MKILLISYYDKHGGAGRANWRIYKALQQAGGDVSMAVIEKAADDPDIHKAIFGPIRWFFWRVERQLRYRLKLRNPIFHSFNFIGSPMPQLIEELNPDIIHLNWFGNGTISLRQLSKLQDKPIVMSLHDEWPYSGAEHYHLPGCMTAHSTGYIAKDRPWLDRFLNRWVWLRKKSSYARIHKHLTLLSQSHWIMEQVACSPLLQTKNIHFLPNPVDLAVFKPQDKQAARQSLGLDPSRKLVLFGAVDPESNAHKGYDLLLAALEHLAAADNKNIALGVFGTMKHKPDFIAGFPVIYFGHVDDDAKLAQIYNAADVMVVPSRIDAGPQTMIEALACGTPVAGFRIGGLPDYVQHGKTGFLATPYDAAELARGIAFVLQATIDPVLCHDTVAHAGYEPVAQHMMDLYRTALTVK